MGSVGILSWRRGCRRWRLRLGRCGPFPLNLGGPRCLGDIGETAVEMKRGIHDRSVSKTRDCEEKQVPSVFIRVELTPILSCSTIGNGLPPTWSVMLPEEFSQNILWPAPLVHRLLGFVMSGRHLTSRHRTESRSRSSPQRISRVGRRSACRRSASERRGLARGPLRAAIALIPNTRQTSMCLRS